jgi:beta-N-acetylglucosaminidase
LTSDEWKTVNDVDLFDDGLGIYSHEFAPEELKAGETLKFTFIGQRQRIGKDAISRLRLGDGAFQNRAAQFFEIQ